jgi:hypothetical protein
MNKDILPQGNNIRQLLVKSNITDASIVNLLKTKGVFLGGEKKNNSVPLLMKTLISPSDFEYLYEIQKNKEENIKHRTASIKCNQNFELSNILNSPINLNALIKDNHTYQPNYKVLGSPAFYFEDENTAIFSYKIERENLLNDWTDSKTYHEGSLLLKKDDDGQINISVQQNLTSKETLEVNKIIIEKVQSLLKTNLLIANNEDFISIRFNDFSNTNRIKFLYSFASNFSPHVTFISLSDLNLYLDSSVESHKDIEKFLAEIENLRLKGKTLQNHVFINSTAYHPKLLFASIVLQFDLIYKSTKGKMYINLSFPDYVLKKLNSAEFQIQINFSYHRKVRNKSKIDNEIRQKILPFIEKLKLSKFKEFKK